MVEELKQIYLIGKHFEFVGGSKNRLIYKSENKELSQFSILELLISEQDRKIKKIDIHTFLNSELLETINVIRGDDDLTEVDYYPNYYENITIDQVAKLYNVSVYLLYSEANNNLYYEYKQIELVKKGHKKHKTLIQKSSDDNKYITKDGSTHYIYSKSINRLKGLTEFLMPSIIELENKMFSQIEIPEKLLEAEQEDTTVDIVSSIYPDEIYIYDRNYHFLGKKGEAIVYQNTEDEIKELEVYFNPEGTEIEEVRITDYYESYIDGVKFKAKGKIVRFVLKDDKIYATLCNRKNESMIMNSHSIVKNKISASAIINDERAIESLEIKVQNQLGTFNLVKSPNRSMEFYDKDNVSYLVTSNSIEQFRMFIRYTPTIMKILNEMLIIEGAKKSDAPIKEKLFLFK